jgi:hypothetical protein
MSTIYLIGVIVSAIVLAIHAYKEVQDARDANMNVEFTVGDLIAGLFALAGSWFTILYIAYAELESWGTITDKTIFTIRTRTRKK